MNNLILYDEITSIISNNYIFKDNQKDIWLSNVEKYRTNIPNLTDKDFLSTVNRLLLTLNDAHTKISTLNAVSKIFDIEFIWISNKIIILPNLLGYNCDLVGEELFEVNDINVYELFETFKKDMINYPIGIIKEDFIKYIKTQRDIDYLSIKVKKNNSFIVDTIKKKSLLEIKSKYSIDETNCMLSPIVFKEIDKNILLIKIFSFRFKNLSDYFFKNNNLINSNKTVVFDIRGNRGGFINETKDVTSLIINKDVTLEYKILSNVNSRGEDVIIHSSNNSMFSNKKLFILCDEYTMSSAEFIFMQSLKICFPAIKIIGQQTAGLSGQAKIFNLSKKFILQVTTKKYIDKNNNEIKSGMYPNLLIDRNLDYYMNKTDPYIDTIKYLCSNLNKEGDLQ